MLSLDWKRIDPPSLASLGSLPSLDLVLPFEKAARELLLAYLVSLGTCRVPSLSLCALNIPSSPDSSEEFWDMRIADRAFLAGDGESW